MYPVKLLLPLTLLFGNGCSVDADLFSAADHRLKLNNAVSKCEECIVFAYTNVCAGMDFCTTLTNEDIACENELTVCSLSTKSLGLGISAVLCGTNAFFMCKKLYGYSKHFIYSFTRMFCGYSEATASSSAFRQAIILLPVLDCFFKDTAISAVSSSVSSQSSSPKPSSIILTASITDALTAAHTMSLPASA